MAILEAERVSKTYRSGFVEVQALSRVDLTIEAGEFLVVTGPSGSGKTTLLNCLSGLDDIDEGEVRVEGVEIHRLSDAKRTELRAREMGFVFQSYNLLPVFTAVENVEIPLLLTGVASREARERSESMLEKVGLGKRKNQRPAELSGGEQQRVAIARALVAEPSLVWADEPTGNLDSATAKEILRLFRQFNSEGQTLVMVTHDASIAKEAPRVVEMRDGKIV